MRLSVRASYVQIQLEMRQHPGLKTQDMMGYQGLCAVVMLLRTKPHLGRAPPKWHYNFTDTTRYCNCF